MTDYLDEVREVERRIQKVEAYNSSGDVRELPSAPIGVPDSFSEHVKLMFDLQALAFASDLTRVFAFKLGRDASNRTYPESGFNGAFHSTSHHGERENTIMDFATINKYHVGMVPYLLERLKNTPDADGTLLDNTLVIYGSPMGDSHIHNHKRCPLFLAGHAGGQLKGGLHLRAADGTPMANVMLTVLHLLGLDDVTSFGDSTGAFDLTQRPIHDRRQRVGGPTMYRTLIRTGAGSGARRPARDHAGVGGAERSGRRRGRAARQGRRRGAPEAGGRRQRAARRRHDGAALGGDQRRHGARLACCCTPARTRKPRRASAATRR